MENLQNRVRIKTLNRTGLVAFFCALTGVSLSFAQADTSDGCANYSIQTALGLRVFGRMADSTPDPTCLFFKIESPRPIGVNEAGFFTDADVTAGHCPEGRWDGTICDLRPAPEGAFLFDNGFYTVPTDGACPADMASDGVNCFWRRAAFGTTALSQDGRWGTTRRPSCSVRQDDGRDLVLGAYDGRACQVAGLSDAPGQHLITEQPDGFHAAIQLSEPDADDP